MVSALRQSGSKRKRVPCGVSGALGFIKTLFGSYQCSLQLGGRHEEERNWGYCLMHIIDKMVESELRSACFLFECRAIAKALRTACSGHRQAERDSSAGCSALSRTTMRRHNCARQAWSFPSPRNQVWMWAVYVDMYAYVQPTSQCWLPDAMHGHWKEGGSRAHIGGPLCKHVIPFLSSHPAPTCALITTAP